MKRLLTASIGVLLAIGLLAGTRAYGQTTRTWDGNGTPDNSGNWSAAANWDGPDNIPDTTGENAALPNVSSGTRTVTMDASYTINQLQMTQTTVGATNKLLLNGTLFAYTPTIGVPPLRLTPPAGGTNSLVLDLNGQTLVTSNYDYCVELNGTVNMGPGSRLDMTLTGYQKWLTLTNLGVLAQNSSTSSLINVVNGAAYGRWVNRGVWSLENNAAFRGVNGLARLPTLNGCENSGTLTVRDGSILTFDDLTSTGYLEAGTNSVLGNAGSTLTIGSGGTFAVNGTNAIVGDPSGSAAATLINAGTTIVGTNAVPAELVVKGLSVGLSNAVGGVLSAVPGSRIVLRFTGSANNARWDNFGTFTQDNVVVQIDWAAGSAGTGTRRISNAGTWTLQNGAQVQYVSSTGRSTSYGFGNMAGNANSGTLSLLSGSSIAMQDLSNTGTLILGTNVTLFTAQFNGGNETLDNRGSVSVVGTNALIGYTNAAGQPVIFNNGSAGSQGALLTIGDGVNGAECIIQGRQARLINFVGNTVTVARASTLRLTGTRNSTENFASLDAYLMNSGVVVNAGTIQLQPSHSGAVNPDNYGTYSIGAGASATGEIQRLAKTAAGNNAYSQLAFNNRAGGTVTGTGMMLYTNKTGDTVADYMQFVNAGTIAPGAPVGTLELVNTAVTNAGGTIAIQLYDETTFDKLKVSGTGAGLKLTGASDTLNVSLYDKFRWGGVKTFRIFEGSPVTGTFDTLLWNGATVNGEYTVVYGSNYVDISVRAPPSGTLITIR